MAFHHGASKRLVFVVLSLMSAMYFIEQASCADYLFERFHGLAGWEDHTGTEYILDIESGAAHIWGNAFAGNVYLSRVVNLTGWSGRMYLETRSRAYAEIPERYSGSVINAVAEFYDPVTSKELGTVELALAGTVHSAWKHKIIEVSDILEGLHVVEIRLGLEDKWWWWDWHQEAWFDMIRLYDKEIGGTSSLGLSVKWVINTSAIFPNRTFGAGHRGSQTIWDIDENGINEVLFGTTEGHSRRLWSFDAAGEYQWTYPSIDCDGLQGDPSAVSIVNIDKDKNHEDYELCLIDSSGILHVLSPDGSIRWMWSNPNRSSMEGPAQALDVDGDGFVEFFLSDNTGLVHRVTHKGEPFRAPKRTDVDIPIQPTIADIGCDGRYELIWSSREGGLYLSSATTGTVFWKMDVDAGSHASPVILPVIATDIDQDTDYEALYPVGSSIHCVDFKGIRGTIKWTWSLPCQGDTLTSQALGDVDEDGRMDMILTSTLGIHCVDIGGMEPVLKWQVNISELSLGEALPERTGGAACPLVADIDGDYELEVMALAPFPVVLNGANGAVEAYYMNEHILPDQTNTNAGWWGDVDDDGVSEWIVGPEGRTDPEGLIYCLTMNGTYPAKAAWPEHYHSAFPREQQKQQGGLTTIGAYSNSLWFPKEDQTFTPLTWGPPNVTGMPGISFYQRNRSRTIDLDDYVTDPDNAPTEIRWSLSGNTHVHMAIDTDTHVAYFHADEDWHGSEEVVLAATDPKGLRGTQTLIITVHPYAIWPPDTTITDRAYELTSDVIMTGSRRLSFNNSTIASNGHRIILRDKAKLMVAEGRFNDRATVIAENETAVILMGLRGTNNVLFEMRGSSSLFIKNSTITSSTGPYDYQFFIETSGSIEVNSSHLLGVDLLRGGQTRIENSQLGGAFVKVGGDPLVVVSSGLYARAYSPLTGSVQLGGEEIWLQSTAIDCAMISVNSDEVLVLNQSKLKSQASGSFHTSRVSITAPSISIFNSTINCNCHEGAYLVLSGDSITIVDSELKSRAYSPKLELHANTKNITRSSITAEYIRIYERPNQLLALGICLWFLCDRYLHSRTRTQSPHQH